MRIQVRILIRIHIDLKCGSGSALKPVWIQNTGILYAQAQDSVADWHHPDLNPTFHFETIQIRILPQILHILENHKNNDSITAVLFYVVFIFNIFDKIFFCKNVGYSLSLHMVEMNTD
jgi:hypothetical protein